MQQSQVEFFWLLARRTCGLGMGQKGQKPAVTGKLLTFAGSLHHALESVQWEDDHGSSNSRYSPIGNLEPKGQLQDEDKRGWGAQFGVKVRNVKV